MGSSICMPPLLWMLAVVAPAPPPAEALISDADLQAAGMMRFWQADLPVTMGDELKEAYRIDDAIYAITRNGTVFSVTADTGLIRWGEKLTFPDYKIYRPTHLPQPDNAGPVVIPTTTGTYILDRFSGKRIRRISLPFPTGSSAVAGPDVLYMGSSDAQFYALQLNYRHSAEPFKRWTVRAGAPVSAAPLLYGNGMLLFASQSGEVFSCRAVDKSFNWSFRTSGEITAAPAADDTGIYVASADRSLYKLHPGTGRVLWRHRMPQPLSSGPIAAGGTVYQYCLHEGITAVGALDGGKQWRRADAIAFAADTANGVALFTNQPSLDLVDHLSGQVNGSVSGPALSGVVTNSIDDAIYLLSRDGRILCARLSGTPYLRRQQVMSARRLLNVGPGSKRQAPDEQPKDEQEKPSDPLRSRRDRPD